MLSGHWQKYHVMHPSPYVLVLISFVFPKTYNFNFSGGRGTLSFKDALFKEWINIFSDKQVVVNNIKLNLLVLFLNTLPGKEVMKYLFRTLSSGRFESVNFDCVINYQ